MLNTKHTTYLDHRAVLDYTNNIHSANHAARYQAFFYHLITLSVRSKYPPEHRHLQYSHL